MAAYITRRLPHLPAPRNLTSIHDDGVKTTIISPLPLSPPATASTPPLEPPSPAPTPATGPETHIFNQDTFAHFLHAFHEHYYNPSPGSGSSSIPGQVGTAHPHFDLVESTTTYTIYGELPGLKREDVLVETNDLMFTVTISGVLRRSIPTEVQSLEALAEHEGHEAGGDPEGGLHWHVQERQVGKFKRQFHLPMGLANMPAVSATMEDGLLCVSVPKTVAEVYREGVRQQRKVPVVGATSGGGGDNK